MVPLPALSPLPVELVTDSNLISAALRVMVGLGASRVEVDGLFAGEGGGFEVRGEMERVVLRVRVGRDALGASRGVEGDEAEGK